MPEPKNVDPESTSDSPHSLLDDFSGSRLSLKATGPSLQQIGHYHLKRIIASGGMGTVYEAVQEHPRRTVAVKILKKGITSPAALRRFEYESQLLARLHHPGIAQVFEAGTHDDGSGPVPYFAMEYVPNAKSITAYLGEKALGTRKCLELFAQVCDAVHHGHLKGIIHRDLKPANILIASPGKVKIIDFGVARSTDSDLAVTTVQTDFGQLVGTLQYMSPEQCESDPRDIDTRSDVYALGIVLYELLCGKLPYNLTGMALPVATRVIREFPPPKPSFIRPGLERDVETIVLKALEKDRDRRYRSAGDLGDDLRRFLSGEAILARPPSVVYQVRKFARRNRTLVGAVLIVFIAIGVGFVFSTYSYIRAEAARVDASQQRDDAIRARTEAEVVTKFLNDTLTTACESVVTGREVTVLQMLDKAALEIADGFADQPLVKAKLRMTIGHAYSALGNYPAAETHLRSALSLRQRQLPDDHLDIAESFKELGELALSQGQSDAAESFFRDALAIRRKNLGNEHPDVAASLNNLAQVIHAKGDLVAAEGLYREVLALRRRLLGDVHRDVATSLNNLALVLRHQGELDEAEPLCREALAVRVNVLGNDHILVAQSLSMLAGLLRDRGDLDAAEPLFRQALAIVRKDLGADHPDSAHVLSDLARLLMKKGDPIAAEPLLREALDVRTKAIPQHWLTAVTKVLWGECLTLQGRYEEAEPWLMEGYRSLAAARGDGDRLTREALLRLVQLYDAWGQLARAATWKAKLEETQKGKDPAASETAARSGAEAPK